MGCFVALTNILRSQNMKIVFVCNSSKLYVRFFSSRKANFEETTKDEPEYDIQYLCNASNVGEIKANISNRKGIGDIDKVQKLYNEIQSCIGESDSGLQLELKKELKKIPNKSCPLLTAYGEVPRLFKEVGLRKSYPFKLKKFPIIARTLFKNENISNFTGHRSYYFIDDLAELEHALIKYTVTKLIDKNFTFVSVPDILHKSVIENCGMATEGERTQVYKLDPEHYGPDLCLSGTSEMALAAYLAGRKFNFSELPVRLAAVSRCFRAETSRISKEKDLFRVHQFTKVEMFGVSAQDASHSLLEEFLQIQEELFTSLGLHFKILDMPLHELGAPAYRKFDIEAWLPGRKLYGEISSCSNCTDYQSRRLGIKYVSPDSDTPVHAHTVNGTACAIPRMLIALFENHQQADGSVKLPEILHQYMRGKTSIPAQSKASNVLYMKAKNWTLDRNRLKKDTS